MTAALQSGYNTFVPDHQASGSLVVSFSRNHKTFSLNQYVQVVPVTKSVGYYLNLTAEEAGRIVNTNLADFIWPDANEAPSGNWGTEFFEFKKFSTIRYAFPFQIGRKSSEQATWDILAQHAAIKAAQAMTARTVAALDVLHTTANWGDHTDTATALGGGKWDAGTPTTPYIKETLNAAAQEIMKDTLGVVKPSDMLLVISPVTASKMAASEEIHTYLKEQVGSIKVLQGTDEFGEVAAAFGLPPRLYGYRVVIEDAVKVTSKKKATRAADFAADSDKAVLVSRPGGLVGVEGPSFSTVTVFSYEEMTVEQKDDPDNRRTQGRVVDDYDVVMTAAASGYLVTDVLT